MLLSVLYNLGKGCVTWNVSGVHTWVCGWDEKLTSGWLVYAIGIGKNEVSVDAITMDGIN